MKSIPKTAKTLLVYLLALLTLSSAATFLFLPSMIANTVASGDTAMYSVGPGGGGAIIYPTINPQDGSTITLSCDMASTYTSVDGGASFKSHQFYDITKYDYNPHDPNIVYAYHRQQVYISRDKGQTFDYFAPKADAIEKIGHNMLLSNAQNATQKLIYKAGMHFTGTGLSNLDATRIEKVYVHPADPNTIFILVSGYGTTVPPVLAKSTDGGETFSVLTRSLGPLMSLRTYAYGIAIVTSSNPAIGDNGDQTLETRFSDYCDMLLVGDLLYILGNNGIVVLDSNTGALVKANPIKSCDGQLVYHDGVLTTYIIPANPDVTSSDPAVAKAAKKNNCLEIRKSVGFDFDTWETVVGGADFRTNFWGKLSMHWTRGGSNMVRVVDRPPIFTQLKVAAADPKTMYIYFNSGFGSNQPVNDTLDRNYGTNNSAGVAVTRDGGETWFWAYEGIRQYAYMDIGSRDMMNAVGRIMFDLVVGPDPDQVIISDAYSAFMTLDGGLTWKSLESNFVREVDGRKFYTTRGVEPAGQGAFAVDPSNPNHQLSGWTDIGLWESFDGGVSWSKIRFKETADAAASIDTTDTWGIAFDPNNPKIVLASQVNSNHYKTAELSENILNVIYGDPSVASIRGRVMQSLDGGATWRDVTINEVAGFPNTYLKILPTDIEFDPCKPGVAYFSSNGLGVFRSTDSGATWSLMIDGIEKQQGASGRYGIGASELTLCTDSKTLFVHTGRTPAAESRRLGDLYYLDLTSNSMTWTKLNAPNGTKGAYYTKGTWIYSIDRAPNGLLYAGTTVRKETNAAGVDRYMVDGECGGAYVSADLGATWRQIYDDTVSVYAVKVDSRHPENLYISALGKVFMSEKGANTTKADWAELATVPHLMPQEFYEDPIHPNRILATTRCGGTWSIAVPIAAYTVTYNLNGGTGAPPTEANKALGATFAAASSAGITAPPGKQFKQWNTHSAGTGTAYAPGATITMPASALTLYAIWENIPITTTYTVTYNLNGGTGTPPTETDKASGATFAAASSAGLIAPPGKQFKQWNTNSLGTGTAYAPGATVTMPATNLTLYAIWENAPIKPPTPPKMIFTTHYESNCWNWFMFIMMYGFVWMWFI